MKPSFSGYTRPVRMSRAFVPASIRSSLVSTPIVRRPCGSTERASLSDSELARSTFAGDTARTTLWKRLFKRILEEGKQLTCWVLRYSPIRDCGFVVQCRLVGRQRESIHVGVRQHRIRLTSTHFCQTRQIHQGQIQYVGAVNPKRYRQLANTFILSCYSKSLLLYFLPNFMKVGELFVDMQKLSPLCIGCTR